ncbi:MAG TPA: glycosyltransferase [Anaerolineales bacterium]|nr:glycosyltransferase [Anaerolineales bacterium]HNC88861.1 glycosyltransferase [Anaerolineales bacterium]HNF36909.1 glycosyltransferase [Anaerolineales bacterium]HUM25539.1 glycosyltransferase [Anaerolineales bacterium]
MKNFPHRLGLQQRVLPSYRVPFFDLLAQSCESMSLFAGQARPVEMIAGGRPQVAAYHEAKNIHLFSGAFYLCHQQNFISWLEEWHPHTLIVEANPRYLATSAAVNWMHARGRKVIGWGLGSPPLSGPLAGFRQKSRISFLSKFDALLAYSQRGADEYAALGFPREKIFVAHNSVSPKPTFNLQPATFKPTPSILFVGRLQARKRVDHLLRACAEMDSKPRLMIVGDGPERAALESLAKDVYPSAEFIGAKHGADLKPYFEQADLFVLPGTGGLAVQEAMSYGLPVIVAKGDGTQDDLVRDGNGWQIQPEDYGALVSTMKNALSDTARLRKMGTESFRIVSEEINIQKMVEVFVDALNSVA